MTDAERKQQKAERVEQAVEWLRTPERSTVVVQRLVERYGVSTRTAERDVSAALRELDREELGSRDVLRHRLARDLEWAAARTARLIERVGPREQLRAIRVLADLTEKRARLFGLLRFAPEEGAPDEVLREATVIELERNADRFSREERQRIIECMQDAAAADA